MLGCTFVAMQMLYWLSMGDHPPAELFWSLGLMIETPDLWALQDAIVGLVATVVAWVYGARWAWALFAIILATECGHSAYSFGLWDYSAYELYLLGTFWASVACFAAAGGKNVGRRVYHCLDRSRLQLRALKTARTQ